MKILVIGGTGLVGNLVCKKLSENGHLVIVGSPSAGVNILSGEGLKEALEGCDIVIDLSNSQSPQGQVALDFFGTAAKNLIGAEKLAKIKHHLVLSIVGTERLQHIEYMQAKKLQEDAVVGSGIPYTIIRSTQFHEHTPTIIGVQGDGKKVEVSRLDYQPIALEDVAEYVVRFALETPRNGIVEIAGPDRGLMTDFVKGYLEEKGEGQTVVEKEEEMYMFYAVPRSALVPSGEFFAGRIKFEDWKKQERA